MSYRIDTSLSPLYLLHFYGHLTPDETIRLFSEVDGLLSRDGKSGVVMVSHIEEEDDHEEDFDLAQALVWVQNRM